MRTLWDMATTVWLGAIIYLLCAAVVSEGAYSSRYRRSYTYDASPSAGFIAGIVVMCVVMISIPFVILICVKCGCCKVRPRQGIAIAPSATLQTTVLPPTQQFGQPVGSTFNQNQYGVMAQYGGQPLQYGQPPQYAPPNGLGQPNGFGQPSGFGQPNGFGQPSNFSQENSSPFTYSGK